MRASVAVGLLLTTSMSMFGMYAAQPRSIEAPPETVWGNGQEGIYSPETGEFVPVTSPDFTQTYNLLQQRRQASAGSTPIAPGTQPYYQPNNYYPGTYHSYSSSGSSWGRGYSYSSGSAEEGSARGGFGGMGHAMGMGHS